MNHITKYIFAILSLIMLAGCSEKDEVRPMDTLAPISLTLSVPADKTNTRVGDPGADTNDQVDWDRLTIIVAYKEKTQGNEIIDGAPKKMVYYDTYTKEEFDRGKLVTHSTSTLSGPDANGFRTYTMYLPLGTCCVYGVTYSKDQGLDLEGELNKINENEDGEDHNSDIYDLQISNDYAKPSGGTTDIAKFISVATGYALKLDKNQLLTSDRDVIVEKNINADINTKQYWRMVLGRLAAKIDIQWDAKGAYEKDEDGKLKYTKVKVSQFTYHGEPEGTTKPDAGYGRLFPTLYHQKVSPMTSVSGHTDFLNTSEISKRNGRVYHYTFPDGTNPPRLTFQLDTEKEGTSKTYNVTFDMSNLKDGFIPARWYKINARISGSKLGEEPNITISKFDI